MATIDVFLPIVLKVLQGFGLRVSENSFGSVLVLRIICV